MSDPKKKKSSMEEIKEAGFHISTPEEVEKEKKAKEDADLEKTLRGQKDMDAKMNKAAADYKKRKQSGEEDKWFKKGGSVKKNWIAGAIKKPGALRQSLGAKSGEKIPAKKLAAAAKKPGKMGQRARLAETLKGFARGGGIESRGKTRGKFV